MGEGKESYEDSSRQKMGRFCARAYLVLQGNMAEQNEIEKDPNFVEDPNEEPRDVNWYYYQGVGVPK